MTIGNDLDAAVALDDDMRNLKRHLFSREGSTRTVYLINGVIYKVDMGYGNPELGGNVTEYDNAKVMRDRLPTGVRIPDMTIYRINGDYVLAAEFVPGYSTGECWDEMLDLPCTCPENEKCLDPILIEDLHAIGWKDSGYGNAIMSDGIVYLVDVAC